MQWKFLSTFKNRTKYLQPHLYNLIITSFRVHKHDVLLLTSHRFTSDVSHYKLAHVMIILKVMIHFCMSWYIIVCLCSPVCHCVYIVCELHYKDKLCRKAMNERLIFLQHVKILWDFSFFSTKVNFYDQLLNVVFKENHIFNTWLFLCKNH